MLSKRSKRFPVLLTPEEWAMLTTLAEKNGLTASDVVRLHIRRAYSEAYGDQSPPKRRKR